MGAHSLFIELDGTLSPTQVRAVVDERTEFDREESGGGSYAGNWTTFTGVKFEDRTFASQEEASVSGTTEASQGAHV